MNTTANLAPDRQTLVCTDRTLAIHRTAEERLRDSGYLALRNVACGACDEEVCLFDRLPLSSNKGPSESRPASMACDESSI